MSGTLTVANGGTGATTAEVARTNLGLGSLSTLSAVSGGTGGTITDGTIINDDISTSAAIAGSKISGWNGTNWDTSYTDRMKWDGGSTGLTPATGRTSLGATTLGSNLFTITNPGAIRFLRVNADNTVSTLSDSDFRTAIGAGTGSIGGSGSSNYVSKWTSTTVLGNSQIIDNGTNVGIGTSSPSAKFSIGNQPTDSGPLFYISTTTGGVSKPVIFVAPDGRVSIGTTSLSSSNNAVLNMGGGIDFSRADSNGNGIYMQGVSFLNTYNNNTFIGKQSGNFSLTSNYTVGVGLGALQKLSSGDYNTAIGHYSMGNPLTPSVTGNSNTGLGYASLYNITTGRSNVGLGLSALQSLTSGDYNTAIGERAMGSANVTGIQNVAIGSQAGWSLTSGNYNILLGGASLGTNSVGNSNISIGYGSAYNNTGSDNVFIGDYAGNTNNGSGNVFIGHDAGRATAGSNKLVIDNTSGSYLIYGEFDNNRVGINDTILSDTFEVGGNMRVGTGTDGCIKDADGTTLVGTCSSDERLKKNIESIGNIVGKLSLLNPVTYNWRADEYLEMQLGTSTEYGLIAQEVEKVFPELVTSDEFGFEKIKFHILPFYLLQGVKDLYASSTEISTKLDLFIASSTINTNHIWTVDSNTGSIKLVSSQIIDMQGQDIVNIGKLISSSGKWSIDENGKLVVREIEANKIKTGEFCMGGKCIDVDKFEALLQYAGIADTQSTTSETLEESNSGGTSTTTTTNNNTSGVGGSSELSVSTTSTTTITSSESQELQDEQQTIPTENQTESSDTEDSTVQPQDTEDTASSVKEIIKEEPQQEEQTAEVLPEPEEAEVVQEIVEPEETTSTEPVASEPTETIESGNTEAGE